MTIPSVGRELGPEARGLDCSISVEHASITQAPSHNLSCCQESDGSSHSGGWTPVETLDRPLGSPVSLSPIVPEGHAAATLVEVPPSQPPSASHGPPPPCVANSPQSCVLTGAASPDPCGPLACTSQVLQPAHADAPAATPTHANVSGEPPAVWNEVVQSAERLQTGVTAFVSALRKFKESDDRSAVPPQPFGERLFAPKPETHFPLAYPCCAGSTTPGPASADMATPRPSLARTARPAEAEPEASPPLPDSTPRPEPWDTLTQVLLAEARQQHPYAAAAGSSELAEQAQPKPYGCHPEETPHGPNENQPAEAHEEPAVHHSGKPHEEPAQPETRGPQFDAAQPANMTEEPAEEQPDDAFHALEAAPDSPAKGQPARADEEPSEQQHAKAEEESDTQKNGQPDSRHLDTGVAAQYRRFPDTQLPEKAMPEPGSLASDGVQYRRFPATAEPDTAQQKQGSTQPEIAKAEPGLLTPGTGSRDAGATQEGATKDEDPGAHLQPSSTSAPTPCSGSPRSAVPALGLGLPDLPQRSPAAAATSTTVHVAGGLYYNECLTMDMDTAKAIVSSATHL